MREREPFTSSIQNGIVIGRYHVGYADIDVAKKAYNSRIATANNKPYPTLIDLRTIVAFDRDAKEFLASDAAYENISAGALLVKSVFQKIAGNFYLYIKTHPIPTRIFTDEDEAIQWLSQYKVSGN